ncbi:hypothetical protein BDP81DRAFT_455055 [Colletotrichum phormii]|uniref:Uncharacterized protein n=1 Tax=Colletotrichum phormii TaxID=359342 RepID=A0AAI9ZG46_9PEZI|nr:uncharacterized protein BDP81DRAFT_455055 [Colletotrichum phormii]KAK1622749.1 hypothetical protein BDP81DRAFT_455055 [Colletotrichum phormii]
MAITPVRLESCRSASCETSHLWQFSTMPSCFSTSLLTREWQSLSEMYAHEARLRDSDGLSSSCWPPSRAIITTRLNSSGHFRCDSGLTKHANGCFPSSPSSIDLYPAAACTARGRRIHTWPLNFTWNSWTTWIFNGRYVPIDNTANHIAAMVDYCLP